MERIRIEARPDWRRQVEAVGMHYHTLDDEIYWDESACYRFTASQIDILEDASRELHRLCLEAVQHIIDHRLFDRLAIPAWAGEVIAQSWRRRDASLYGRFDLAWSGQGAPKLLEYNADTPTALLEAGVVQWFWLEACFPDADQFNSIHEKLIAFWQHQYYCPVHFAAALDNWEDFGNLQYLRDTAIQAGLKTHSLDIADIGWDDDNQCFVDDRDQTISTLFKLYPWEWLWQDEFGHYATIARLNWLEPPWKALLSNKGILAILWELFPGHPNLLPASFAETPLAGARVRKPLFSREGANIEIHRDGNVLSSAGTYGREGFVYQQYQALPNFDGQYPVIGAWIIDGQPAGIGIREDNFEITSDNSRFIPHYFVEDF